MILFFTVTSWNYRMIMILSVSVFQMDEDDVKGD